MTSAALIDPAKARILDLANERGKFAIQIGYRLPLEEQLALEEMLIEEWVRLIDVTPLEHSHGAVCRVFAASKDAMLWHRDYRRRYG